MIESSLNVLHYCIYRIHYKLHLLINRINPFRLIHRLPCQKRRYAELGIDIEEEVNKAFSDKRKGLSTIVAGGAIVGILFIFMMAISNLVIELSTVHFIVLAMLSTALCYMLVFRRDKYLLYFEIYEKWTKHERVKYHVVSLSFIVAVILLFVWSLNHSLAWGIG